MTTQTEQSDISTIPRSRAQTCWLGFVQMTVLGLTALALSCSAVPAQPRMALLGLLAVACLLGALVRTSQQSAITGALAGVLLATACWLSADKTWDIPQLTGYVPLMTPIIVVAALLLAIWGAIIRVGLADASRLGVGALAGGVLIGACGILFYLVINYTPAFRQLYHIERYQLEELLSAVLLYPPAIWLGGIGIRVTARPAILPPAVFVIVWLFLVHWFRG